MNYLDVFLLAIVVALTVRGVMRGLVSEVAGVVGVVGGVVLAGCLYHDFADVLKGVLGSGTWVYAVSYVCVLAGFMLLTGIVARLLGHVADFGFAQSVNHALGGVAGFAKGFAAAAVVCYLTCLLVPRADVVRDSRILPLVRDGMRAVGTELPRTGAWRNLPTADDLRKLPERMKKSFSSKSREDT